MVLWQFTTIAALIAALLIYVMVLTNRLSATNALLKRIEEVLLKPQAATENAPVSAAEESLVGTPVVHPSDVQTSAEQRAAAQRATALVEAIRAKKAPVKEAPVEATFAQASPVQITPARAMLMETVDEVALAGDPPEAEVVARDRRINFLTVRDLKVIARSGRRSSDSGMPFNPFSIEAEMPAAAASEYNTPARGARQTAKGKEWIPSYIAARDEPAAATDVPTPDKVAATDAPVFEAPAVEQVAAIGASMFDEAALAEAPTVEMAAATEVPVFEQRAVFDTPAVDEPAVAEAAPEAKVALDAEAAPDAEVALDAEAVPDAKVALDAEAAPEAKAAPEAEAAFDAEVTPETEVVPEAEPVSEAEPVIVFEAAAVQEAPTSAPDAATAVEAPMIAELAAATSELRDFLEATHSTATHAAVNEGMVATPATPAVALEESFLAHQEAPLTQIESIAANSEPEPVNRVVEPPAVDRQPTLTDASVIPDVPVAPSMQEAANQASLLQQTNSDTEAERKKREMMIMMHHRRRRRH